MKILQINAVYGTGSTGRIVEDIHTEIISRGHESFVLWGTKCKSPNSSANIIRIGKAFDHKWHALMWRLTGKQAWYSKRATKKACEKIIELSPDVVHLHNLHSNYINLPYLLDFLGDNDIPTLITLHDCWFFTGGCTHYLKYGCNGWEDKCENCPMDLSQKASKMLEARKILFGRIKHLGVNGVSEWTTDAARRSILEKSYKIEKIYNWIDIEVFCPRNNTAEVRKKYNVPEGRKIILGVSQGWSERKGLKEFLYLAEKFKDTATIILVGRCDAHIDCDNIRLIGFTESREELIDLYAAADVFVNPSRMETFGLVTVEAMACGTPVAAYDNTGSSELVVDECGCLAEDGNVCELFKAVGKILDNGKCFYTQNCIKYVKENFDKNTQIEKYIKLYETLSKTKRGEICDEYEN
ncbi:MAG: glycosyltransferase [Clostridia bacterium]|nr:glycosyltransferase [Clostridia bacterium]